MLPAKLPTNLVRSLNLMLVLVLGLGVAAQTPAIAQTPPVSAQRTTRRTTIIIRPAPDSYPDRTWSHDDGYDHRWRDPRWRGPRWRDRHWRDDRPRYRNRRDISPPSALPPSNTQNCIDLTVMARIAYIWEPESDLSRMVFGAQIANCLGQSDPTDNNIVRWRNGGTARFGDRWYYPNGQPFRFGDTWHYPNGRTLNWGSSWQYPNGRSARFGPHWYTPTGNTVSEQELIAWACSILPSRRCSDRLAAVRNAPRFWYELTLLELAWSAYQWN